MRPKQYKVSDAVVGKARHYGVYGDTRARLSRMAYRAAPITSEYGNRRFHSFVLLVQGDVIKDVTRIAS